MIHSYELQMHFTYETEAPAERMPVVMRDGQRLPLPLTRELSGIGRHGERITVGLLEIVDHAALGLIGTATTPEGLYALNAHVNQAYPPGASRRAIHVTTAARRKQVTNNAPWVGRERRWLDGLGFHVVEADSLHVLSSDQLNQADLLLLTGGDTGEYLLDDISGKVYDFHRRGKTIIGNGSGALVMSNKAGLVMPYDDYPLPSLAADQMTGIGLIHFGIIPHSDHPAMDDVKRHLCETGNWVHLPQNGAIAFVPPSLRLSA